MRDVRYTVVGSDFHGTSSRSQIKICRRFAQVRTRFERFIGRFQVDIFETYAFSVPVFLMFQKKFLSDYVGLNEKLRKLASGLTVPLN